MASGLLWGCCGNNRKTPWAENRTESGGRDGHARGHDDAWLGRKEGRSRAAPQRRRRSVCVPHGAFGERGAGVTVDRPQVRYAARWHISHGVRPRPRSSRKRKRKRETEQSSGSRALERVWLFENQRSAPSFRTFVLPTTKSLFCSVRRQVEHVIGGSFSFSEPEPEPERGGWLTGKEREASGCKVGRVRVRYGNRAEPT